MRGSLDWLIYLSKGEMASFHGIVFLSLMDSLIIYDSVGMQYIQVSVGQNILG